MLGAFVLPLLRRRFGPEGAVPAAMLIYAAGIALITWVIRSFGAYPDGIAFATLLMNIAVPLIDLRTQPAVFGRKP